MLWVTRLRFGSRQNDRLHLGLSLSGYEVVRLPSTTPLAPAERLGGYVAAGWASTSHETGDPDYRWKFTLARWGRSKRSDENVRTVQA